MNSKIADELARAANAYKMANQHWKHVAYDRASKTIRQCNVEIKSGSHAKTLALRGIGKSMQRDIDDILEYGRLDLPVIHDPSLEIKERFIKVWGAGPATATRWYKKGFVTLDDILASGDYTDRQYLGIKYYDDITRPELRVNLRSFVRRVCKSINSISGVEWVRATGSFRRRSEKCGDLDFLVIAENPANIIKRVVKLLKDILVAGDLMDETYMGICDISGRFMRIDIKVYKPKHAPFAKLYFTGNVELNKQLRNIALKRGYTLSDTCLKKTSTGNKVSNIYSERDIFEWANMPYLKPSERNI